MVEILILVSQMFVRGNVGYFVEVICFNLVLIRQVKIRSFIFILLVSIKSAALCSVLSAVASVIGPEVGLFGPRHLGDPSGPAMWWPLVVLAFCLSVCLLFFHLMAIFLHHPGGRDLSNVFNIF